MENYGLSLIFLTKKLYLLTTGAIAQLARVLDWQSRGRGFESP